VSNTRLPKLTFWRTVVAVIFLAGAYAAYARFALGFQQSTNLVDSQPWGLWVSLGTLCGVGISAGGFAIAVAVYLLGFERYRPVVRAAVLLSFLGYLTVIVGMMYELGLPWRIWHPIVMWNRHSALFEVSWCVMLNTTVLSLEFSPSLVEKIPWVRLRDLYLKWHHQSSDCAGPDRRHPVITPSIVPWRALSARQGQGRPALVQLLPADSVLSLGGAGRVGGHNYGCLSVQPVAACTG